MDNFIKFENVSKFYQMGEQRIVALNGMTFHINEGEFCIIVGPSGSGKTTLLNILGGMDSLDEGRAIVGGEDVSKFNESQLATYRRYSVGFVFQFYNLVQNLTALENVELATEICKNPLDPKASLDDVGLNYRYDNFPAQLSGGEQQRVSIARALAKNPKVVLCDEPTGALDYKTGKTILQLLYDTCKKSGKTIVVVTHNLAIRPMADRIITVKNGEVIGNFVNRNPIKIENIEW